MRSLANWTRRAVVIYCVCDRRLSLKQWSRGRSVQRIKERASTFDGLVRLGTKKQRSREPLRLVRVQTDRGELLLVSNKQRQELSAQLLAEIYRHRWHGGALF